jgi:hypothetical protein
LSGSFQGNWWYEPSYKSGYSNDPIMTDYMRYGFAGIIARPYDIKQLSELLHALLALEAEVPANE